MVTIAGLKTVLVGIVAVLAGMGAYVHEEQLTHSELQPAAFAEIVMSEIPMRVEIADTSHARAQGLSGRHEIGSDGLLFIFDTPGTYGFWMKDMLFPIDIIWINEDHVVVGVTENMEPGTFPEIFEPSEPVLYVLEVPAHFAEKIDVEVGEVVEGL